MPARHHACGAAAGENDGRCLVKAFYLVGFEKRNGQKAEVLPSIHRLNGPSGGLTILAENRVGMQLSLVDFTSQCNKVFRLNVKNLFRYLGLRVQIQLIVTFELWRFKDQHFFH